MSACVEAHVGASLASCLPRDGSTLMDRSCSRSKCCAVSAIDLETSSIDVAETLGGVYTSLSDFGQTRPLSSSNELLSISHGFCQ